jgi:DNA-binding CsgD family transcriptional regulator
VSVLFSQPQETSDRQNLGNLLVPMQFKTVLLLVHGLRSCDIAQVLGTTEQVIKNALSDACSRTSCGNTGELVQRYYFEIKGGLLELGRVRREMEELEAALRRVFILIRGPVSAHQ